MPSFYKWILVVFLLVGVSACKPNKVLDPHDPNFDIKQFRYGDYKYSDDPDRDVSEVLKFFFPIGTKRSVIEDTLVSNGTVLISASGSFGEFGSLGVVRGELLEKISASYYAVYHFKYKSQSISLTPSGGVRLCAFYDDGNKLVSMIIGSKFVHTESFGSDKRK
ncbi:hypothetical protein A11S_854 [Micavibrio aeruginosavorus EPB]|uniref:Lipoprotein n=1 Tax=Micavibrio aeruginosavorus EPB TaxID=349215 RepID=M4VE75_9BACT|nr:hypothetical protein A11S_854 [Micavibrio aeruginosavorus EPB]